MEQAVRGLDCSALEQAYAGRGSPAYRPDIMLRLALYETMRGEGSPVRWAEAAKDSLRLRWLLRGTQPSARACYRFRDRMGAVVQDLHAAVLTAGRQEGLFEYPEVASQDGSYHRASASRHRLMNKEQLTKRRQELEEVIRADGEGRQPSEPLPYWMPKTPAGRRGLLARMEIAAEVLEERLKHNAEKRKSHRLKEKHICVSLSDPHAALTRDKEKVFCPLYNTQYLTSYETYLIFGFMVSTMTTDVGTLIPMVDQVQVLTNGSLQKVVTDATYATVLELEACKQRNVELIAPFQENSWTDKNRQRKGVVSTSNKRDFIWLENEQTYQCPAGHKLHYEFKEQARRAGGRAVTMYRYRCPPEHCMGCPLAASCVKDPSRGRTVKRLEGQELIDAHQQRMKEPDARELLRYRGSVVERSIADAKEHRDGRRLHGRGLLRATAEIGMMVMCQNILALDRLRQLKNYPQTITALIILFLSVFAFPRLLAAHQDDVGHPSNICICPENSTVPQCLPDHVILRSLRHPQDSRESAAIVTLPMVDIRAAPPAAASRPKLRRARKLKVSKSPRPAGAQVW